MEVNETPYDSPIAQWQETIDEGVSIIQSARERVGFALDQRDKLVLERLRWLGEKPIELVVE